MTDMGRCRDCRHWVADRMSMRREPPPAGAWGECDLITLSDEPVPARSYGDFATKADFGCVLWEARA